MTDIIIEAMNASIKKFDNDSEDNHKLKDSYAAFISLREGSNIYEKNINEFI